MTEDKMDEINQNITVITSNAVDKKIFCSQSLPFTYPFRGGLRQGKSILIKGKLTGDRGFIVDFCDEEEIGFHFNPRPIEDSVVKNTLKKGEWGIEERDNGFPFHIGQIFQLYFMMTKTHFEVYVNQKPFTTYRHRVEFMGQYKKIDIYGQVEIKEVHI